MKIGAILPSIALIPSDMSLLLPKGVQVLGATLNGRNGLPGEAQRNLDAMQRATDVLVDEGADAIVVMGIPVAARRGLAEDRSALAGLTAARGAVPIASSLDTVAAALRYLDAERPLFVTQYNPPLNEAIIAYCRDAGVDVLAARGLGAGNAAEVNALTEADFEELAMRLVAEYPQADAIVLSARASMLSLSRRLEARFGFPVLEQNQTSLWWAMERLGIALPKTGDRLFEAAGERA